MDALHEVPTSIRLPKKLLSWARSRAATNGQTFSSFMRVTLESLKHDEDQATRKRKLSNLEAINHERNNPSYYK